MLAPERPRERQLAVSEYWIAHDVDLHCYPNYSFAAGELDGDGRKEMVSATQNGNRIRAVRLDGSVVFDANVANHGNWGTLPLVLLDIDGDGRDEVVVPSIGSRFESRILVLDGTGRRVAEKAFGTFEKDDFGLAVPLLSSARLLRGCGPCVVAGLAGGTVVALDAQLREMWRSEGMRKDFGHELSVADIDGDGLDEIALCTLDHANGGYAGDGWNTGELVLLDHDGRTLLRRRVDRYFPDTHFDEVVMADFRGIGAVEILLEKGILIDREGAVVWNVADRLEHGQWIAHGADPGGPGRIVYISELWGSGKKTVSVSSDGKTVRDVLSLGRESLGADSLSGWRVLPTRPHVIEWTPGSGLEVFVGAQALNPTSHDCFATSRFSLRARFFNIRGEQIGVLPFDDAQIEGYWYNGETHSQVSDVDGDGMPEIVFPKQNGHAIVIKKRV